MPRPNKYKEQRARGKENESAQSSLTREFEGECIVVRVKFTVMLSENLRKYLLFLEFGIAISIIFRYI